MTTDTEALICDCPAKNMPFGRCCKLEPLAALRAAFESTVSEWGWDTYRNKAGDYATTSTNGAWAGYQAGHAAAKAEDAALLGLLADIRAAAGDPTGKLMQYELVAHIAGLRAGAETAEVEEPLFWFRPSSVNGLYEGPLHNAQIEQVRKDSGAWVPLYTASQLAAAVAAERGKCAGIVNELRMECARRNMPESATMLWHAEDAIRAGAKEPSDAA